MPVPTPIATQRLDPGDSGWPEQIERLRTLLGAPHNPSVFPSHFLRVVLPRIGGHALEFTRGQQAFAAGFLFPRALQSGQRVYTLRVHALASDVDLPALAQLAAEQVAGCQVVPYDPAAEHIFDRTTSLVGGWDAGSPSADEAAAVRALQEQIWGLAADNLYPTDIHSRDFGSTVSQVVRAGARVVAFLFGFYRFEGSPLPPDWEGRVDGAWRLESQLLGVQPDLRGQGIATVLKAQQAELARRAGIDIVNWTADPLLWPNAVLNFERLGASAFHFVPGMYPFRNELNRVAASRLVLTWLINSSRVRDHLSVAGAPGTMSEREAAVVNEGRSVVRLNVDAPVIAVEIPADWVLLQKRSLSEAEQWRRTTDEVLAHYLGTKPGKYVLTGVGQEGERRFLTAERVTEDLLHALVGTG